MAQVRAFVALIAPWLGMPSDRRMNSLLLLVIAVVLVLGVGTAGWLAIEAVTYAVGRTQREDVQ